MNRQAEKQNHQAGNKVMEKHSKTYTQRKHKKTDAILNHRKRRKMRETASRRVVEYAPYIMTMSKTPK